MYKKVAFGAVLIVILLLATAGAVSAAYLLKTQTNVNQNDIGEQDIYITPSTNTDILGDINFDTVNTAGTKTYKLHYDYNSSTGTLVQNGGDSTLISKTGVTINVAKTSGVNVDGFDLKVTATAFTPVAGLTYTMKIGDQAVANVGSTWTFTDLAYDTDLTVLLYVKNTSTEVIIPESDVKIGFTNYSAPAVEGTVFQFVATSNY